VYQLSKVTLTIAAPQHAREAQEKDTATSNKGHTNTYRSPHGTVMVARMKGEERGKGKEQRQQRIGNAVREVESLDKADDACLAVEILMAKGVPGVAVF